MNKTNRRSAIQIMGQLIGLVKPLLIFMILCHSAWYCRLFMCDLPDYPCRSSTCSWTYSTIIFSHKKSTSRLYAC